MPIHRVTRAQALELLERWIAERQGTRLVMTPDTPALLRARRDPALLEAYEQADLVTPDGAGLVWASRTLNPENPLPMRVSGIDLLEAFCARAAERGYRVFFLGAAPGVAQEAAARLQARHPKLKVVGARHGYFSAEEEPSIVRAIGRARPDALFVGLGVPKQELWMVRHRAELAELDVPVVMGVGGAFDVLAGRLPRAPERWRRLGLEWLWRTLREPWRVRRVWRLPLFVLGVLALRAARATRFLLGYSASEAPEEGSKTSSSSSRTRARPFQLSRSSLQTRSTRPAR